VKKNYKSKILEMDAQWTDELLREAVGAVRAGNMQPSSDDYRFYVTDDEFRNNAEGLSRYALRLMSQLANWISPDDIPNIESFPDDFERFEIVADVTDTALDRIDNCLNKLSQMDQKEGETAPSVSVDKPSNLNAKRRSRTQQALKGLFKPQLQFKDKVDNSWLPFMPKISLQTGKPNAKVPLLDYQSIAEDIQKQWFQFGPWNKTRVLSPFAHPYEHEIESYSYAPEQLGECREILYSPMSEVSCKWIDSLTELENLSKLLETVKEFAVDLEAHNMRSYQGFVCLMQISTRNEDFLIDAIALREHMHILNSSFTNPLIVKVLHGADSDILWLQRDFGIYVVNMFDTAQAAKALEFPRIGLAFLLQQFCDEITDKKFQLADWRVRPLSAEMLKYARMDTHFLLYIYDRVRNKLIELNRSLNVHEDKYAEVLENSRALCLQKYEKPVLSLRDDVLNLSSQFMLKSSLKPDQLKVLYTLYLWRDTVARAYDESPQFIMKDTHLVALIHDFPVLSDDLLRICHPASDCLKENALKVIDLINDVLHNRASYASVLSTVHISWISPAAFDPLKDVMVTVFEDLEPALSEFTVPSTHQVFRKVGWVDHTSQVLNDSLLKQYSQFDFSSNLGEDQVYSKGVTLSDQNRNFTSSSEYRLGLAPASDADLGESNDISYKQLAQRIMETFGEKASEFELSNVDLNTLDPEIEQLPQHVDDSEEPEDFAVQPDEHSSQLQEEMDGNDLPLSMDEIVKMSNKNKRRNKEKKKLKTNFPPTPDSSQVFEPSEVAVSGEHSISITSEPTEFMKDIGWTKDSEQFGQNNDIQSDYNRKHSYQQVTGNKNSKPYSNNIAKQTTDLTSAGNKLLSNSQNASSHGQNPSIFTGYRSAVSTPRSRKK
jgi:exosome complex exonuclease RRP6